MRGIKANPIGSLLCAAILALSWDCASAQERPKYTPCPSRQLQSCHQDISGGCTGWCSNGPMTIAPSFIEACEDQPVTINVRIQGGKMDLKDNKQEAVGGEIDWFDGMTTGLFPPGPLNQNFTHTYHQANKYYLSATFGDQRTYSSAGRSCSYRCRLQQAAVVVIHLKTSPQCKTGLFQNALEPFPVQLLKQKKKSVTRKTVR
jgi:hypothetical protein